MVVGEVGTARQDGPRSAPSSAEPVDRAEYEVLLLERLRAEYARLRERTATAVVGPLDLRAPF